VSAGHCRNDGCGKFVEEGSETGYCKTCLGVPQKKCPVCGWTLNADAGNECLCDDNLDSVFDRFLETVATEPQAKWINA
jgi:hypothetical protein